MNGTSSTFLLNGTMEYSALHNLNSIYLHMDTEGCSYPISIVQAISSESWSPVNHTPSKQRYWMCPVTFSVTLWNPRVILLGKSLAPLLQNNSILVVTVKYLFFALESSQLGPEASELKFWLKCGG